MDSQTSTPDLASLIQAAKAHIEAGELEAGLHAFREIAQNHPEIPEVFNNLGAICAAMEYRDQAEEAFSEAARLTPSNPNPLYNRGLMRFQGGNYLGAVEDFERATDLAPQDPEIHNNLGVGEFQLQHWGEARAALEKAVELRPDYVAAHLNLVDVDMAQGDLEGAIQRCQQAIDQEATPEALTKMVECQVRLAADTLDAAADACESALAQGDDVDDVRQTYGQIARARQVLTEKPDQGSPEELQTEA